MPTQIRGSSTSITDRTTAPIKAAPKTIGSPGNTTGREVIRSWSLAKVTIEPANDTAPMAIVNAVAARLNHESWPPASITCCSSRRATSDAAPPPTPLKSATIWGIWVICTVRAPYTPPTVPIAIAIRIGTWWWRWSSGQKKGIVHATTAATAPSRLPLRAVLGPERPLSARMKQTPQARKTSWIHVGIRRPRPSSGSRPNPEPSPVSCG